MMMIILRFLIPLGIMILLEATFLKLFLKKIKWLKHLLYSIVINLISILPGAFLIITTQHLCGAVLPLISLGFILQLLLISIIYRKYFKWYKGMGIAVIVNIGCYIGIIIITTLLNGIVSSYYYYNQKNNAYSEKSSEAILSDEIGSIYTVQKVGKIDYFLKAYDVTGSKWGVVAEDNDDIVFYYQEGWDITKNYLAYPTGSEFSLIDRKGYHLIKRIQVEADDLKFSPDEKLIAILTEGDDISFERDMTNFKGGVVVSTTGGIPITSLGNKSTLTIVDIDTETILVDERDIVFFDDGLSWSPDGTKLLLSSFKDKEADFNENLRDVENAGLILNQPKSKYVCEYNIPLKTLTPLFEGYCGRYSPDGEHILFIKDNNFMLYTCKSQETKTLHSIYDHNPMPQWSPNGNSIVAFEDVKSVGFDKLFSSRIYVMSVEDPNMMLIIGDEQEYKGLRWIAE